MSDFIDRILEQAGYSKFISDDTHEMIDVLLGRSQRRDEDCNCTQKKLEPDIRPDNADEVDNNELNNIVKYRKKFNDADASKEFYSLLHEAVKCPNIRKQYVIVDLGYAKAKLTTECLLNAIEKGLFRSKLIVSKNKDGFYIRLNRRLLQDNSLGIT